MKDRGLGGHVDEKGLLEKIKEARVGLIVIAAALFSVYVNVPIGLAVLGVGALWLKAEGDPNSSRKK
jgi:hypothetical protein